MEPLEERTVAGFPPTMQMIYWTGAVAQRDVALEHTLAGVHARLVTAPGKRPEGVSNFVKAIRRLVEADGITNADLSQLALALLVDIDEVHSTRNRLVHDLWWHSPLVDGKTFDQLLLRRQEPRGLSVRHLDDFQACAAQLAICEFRATALGVLLDTHSTSTTQHDDRASWLAALAGGVELTEGGGYRITHDRPRDTHQPKHFREFRPHSRSVTTCPRCKQPTSNTLAGMMCFTPECSQVEVPDTRNL